VHRAGLPCQDALVEKALRGITNSGRYHGHRPHSFKTGLYFRHTGIPRGSGCLLGGIRLGAGQTAVLALEKKYDEFEFWVGDAMCDNFVKSDSAIIPIDLRLWLGPTFSHSE